jgi:hypothetical protein
VQVPRLPVIITDLRQNHGQAQGHAKSRFERGRFAAGCRRGETAEIRKLGSALAITMQPWSRLRARRWIPASEGVARWIRPRRPRYCAGERLTAEKQLQRRCDARGWRVPPLTSSLNATLHHQLRPKASTYAQIPLRRDVAGDPPRMPGSGDISPTAAPRQDVSRRTGGIGTAVLFDAAPDEGDMRAREDVGSAQRGGQSCGLASARESPAPSARMVLMVSGVRELLNSPRAALMAWHHSSPRCRRHPSLAAGAL